MRKGVIPAATLGNRGGFRFKRDSCGESGGGAYSNPHRRKKALNDGFMAQGGQRNMSYHGLGLLGGGKTGGNLNAPSEEDLD